MIASVFVVTAMIACVMIHQIKVKTKVKQTQLTTIVSASYTLWCSRSTDDTGAVCFLLLVVEVLSLTEEVANAAPNSTHERD